MLPFLKHKPVAGVIISKRKAEGGLAEQAAGDEESLKDDAGLEACAHDLIRAIEAEDAKAAAAAMRAAFEICESEPHEEGPHTYEAQNQKAAQENE